AAEGRRSRLSEDGGAGKTRSSSSVRRARSSRATLPNPTTSAGRGFWALRFRGPAGFERFAQGRAPARRAVTLLARPADFARFPRLAAALLPRFGMMLSFRNLDSLAISIVLSVAYRESAIAGLAKAVAGAKSGRSARAAPARGCTLTESWG